MNTQKIMDRFLMIAIVLETANNLNNRSERFNLTFRKKRFSENVEEAILNEFIADELEMVEFDGGAYFKDYNIATIYGPNNFDFLTLDYENVQDLDAFINPAVTLLRKMRALADKLEQESSVFNLAPIKKRYESILGLLDGGDVEVQLTPRWDTFGFTASSPSGSNLTPELKAFMNSYGTCPICRTRNHSIQDIFNSRSPDRIEIRKQLEAHKEGVRFKGISIKFGIPCCNCFRRIFKDETRY